MRKPFTYAKYLVSGKLRNKKVHTIDGIPYLESIHGIYAGKKVEPMEQIQREMADKIKSGEPFMAARFGAVEIAMARAYEFDDKRIIPKDLKQLCDCSGFFPNRLELLPRYYEEVMNGCKNCDYLAVWFMPFEDYYIKNVFPKDVHLTYLHHMDPFKYPEHPWSEALEGKKVLVIHPEANLIQHQYKNHEHIFEGTNILPEFELIPMKAVQTLAGEEDERYETWFDALEDMFERAMRIDFDVAILGCGAYAFPLAAKMKQAGKQAIHMGGITQIMFGIRGKRWDNDPNHQYLNQYYNEYWARPTKLKKGDIVEGGCYW